MLSHMVTVFNFLRNCPTIFSKDFSLFCLFLFGPLGYFECATHPDAFILSGPSSHITFLGSLLWQFNLRSDVLKSEVENIILPLTIFFRTACFSLSTSRPLVCEFC